MDGTEMTPCVTDAVGFLWSLFHRDPAWLENLTRLAQLGPGETQAFADYDDGMIALGRSRTQLWKQAVSEAIAEFKAEADPDWARARRIAWLEQEIHGLRGEISSCWDDYAVSEARDEPFESRALILAARDVSGMERRLARLERELLHRKSPPTGDDLTEAQLERARSRPLTDLLEAKRGYVKCPFHDDNKPSMWVKGGFGWCFVCAKGIDSIGYLMQFRGLKFREAVEALQ